MVEPEELHAGPGAEPGLGVTGDGGQHRRPAGAVRQALERGQRCLVPRVTCRGDNGTPKGMGTHAVGSLGCVPGGLNIPREGRDPSMPRFKCGRHEVTPPPGEGHWVSPPQEGTQRSSPPNSPAGLIPARLHSMAWKGRLRKSLLVGTESAVTQ